MKSLIVIASLLLSSVSFAGNSNALPLCKTLQDRYQTETALTCVKIAGDNTYDVAALGIATELANRYQYGSVIDALNAIQGKTYGPIEISTCTSFLNQYNYTGTITCLKTTGTPVAPVVTCPAPIIVNSKDLLAKVKKVQVLLVDRSQASIDQAFQTLEEMRTILEQTATK